jgi:elongation factor P hydroxylase
VTITCAAPCTGVPGALDHLGLCALFDGLFLPGENTRLLSGGEEPVYLPADQLSPHHRVVFRHDYVSSALHEVAHWCIAGPARRLLPDYGYWYSPDGRSAEHQIAFERLEARPQALEWIFSRACGLPFRPSIDNLNGTPADAAAFAEAIAREAQQRCVQGLPHRAARFRAALLERCGTDAALRATDFRVAPAWTP